MDGAPELSQLGVWRTKGVLAGNQAQVLVARAHHLGVMDRALDRFLKFSRHWSATAENCKGLYFEVPGRSNGCIGLDAKGYRRKGASLSVQRS